MIERFCMSTGASSRLLYAHRQPPPADGIKPPTSSDKKGCKVATSRLTVRPCLILQICLKVFRESL